MKEIHEMAELLESKRLIWLRLNLFGFAMAGLFRLIQTYFLAGNDFVVMTVLGLVGSAIWVLSLFKLMAIGRKIERDATLKQVFNDDLAVQNRLKAWKVGFFAVLITQAALLILSVFQPYDGLFAVELTLYVAVCSAIGASIVQEEILAISLFHMEVDEKKYSIWNWRSLSFFHWIVNPGIVVGELFLGQRAPKVMLIDKQSEAPFLERCYVPCPSCETIHSSLVWSAPNKTHNKNHYGLYCPSCGDIIPCLRNAFSMVLIALTYPLWFWNADKMKAKWLAKQPDRFQNISIEANQFKNIKWTKMGVKFGLFMFLFMTFAFKAGMLFFMEDEVTDYVAYFLDPIFLAVNAVIWPLATWLFIYLLKRMMNRKSSEGESILTKKVV